MFDATRSTSASTEYGADATLSLFARAEKIIEGFPPDLQFTIK